MASDSQLREDFPRGHEPLPEDGFTGDVAKDALSAIPPALRKSYEAIAHDTRYEPCKVQAEAARIYNGLQNGTLTYKGINADNPDVVEFQKKDGSVVSMHGGHVSSMVESYGLDEVGDLLKDKLPLSAKESVARGLSDVGIGTVLDSLISNPELKRLLPVHPKTDLCAMM